MFITFLHALGGVFSLIIVVILGYCLAKRGWFDQSFRKMLPKLITNICLPPFLAATIVTSFPRDKLISTISSTLIPFMLLIILFGGAYIFAKLAKINRRHLGLFCACVSNPNTIFIGIPVNQALFGPESLTYVLLYYFASTVFFWTVGNYFISLDPGDDYKSEVKHKLRWQQILSPPMLGFLCGMLIIILNINIPEFIIRPCMLIGEMTTPLALIFIGLTLEGIGLNKLKPTRDMLFAAIGRLVVSPMLMFLLVPLFALPELMGKVFIIQSSLPVIVQISILSAYYNTDPQFGTMMVAITTILCVITIPVYMCLL